jgi:ATP-binding cassette, subfamily B (MDR/TAP), member 1
MAMAQAASAASEIFATINAKCPDMSGLQDADVSVKEDIAFEDVSFVYPTRPNVQILDKLTVRFPAGRLTAIVGPSGSGKSTIVGLLQRWYSLHENAVVPDVGDPENSSNQEKEPKTDEQRGQLGGVITVGHTDLEKIDAKWWRTQIGFVQQEPFLFNDTIFNNVAFGLCGTEYYHEPEKVKRDLVEEACKEAFAHDFITALPQGYDTMVGESGLRLSGGQRQRLSIARSIIKKPAILILDEATSALDVQSERIVQQALDRIAQGRTTIVIAHRLSTIRKADKIVVLRQGSILEEGSHDELLQLEDGFYKNLVKAQAILLGTEADDIGPEIHMDDDGLPTISREITKKSTTEEKEIQSTEQSDASEKPLGPLTGFGKLIRVRTTCAGR